MGSAVLQGRTAGRSTTASDCSCLSVHTAACKLIAAYSFSLAMKMD